MRVQPSESFDRRFWWTHAVLPGLLFCLLVLPFELTELDLWLSDPFFDFANRRWLYIDAWWASVLVHKGGKFFVWALGSVPLVVLLGSWHVPRWARWRRTAVYLIVCMAATPAIVATLKILTHRHCPWGMQRYGGTVPWTSLFEFGPPMLDNGQQGRCFPAAHAATGLGLVALYFVGRAMGRRRLWLWAAPGLLLGAIFAWGQQVRGAHFFSHNLWSLAVAWCLALGLYRAMGGLIGPLPTEPLPTDLSTR